MFLLVFPFYFGAEQCRKVADVQLFRERSGQRELEVLNKLRQADPDSKYHCLVLYRSFTHRNHLCLVFESLRYNTFITHTLRYNTFITHALRYNTFITLPSGTASLSPIPSGIAPLSPIPSGIAPLSPYPQV